MKSFLNSCFERYCKMTFGIFLNLKNLRRSNIKQLNKKYLFRVTGDRINLQNGKLRGTRRKLYKIHTRASSNGRVPVPETRCVKKKKGNYLFCVRGNEKFFSDASSFMLIKQSGKWLNCRHKRARITK